MRSFSIFRVLAQTFAFMWREKAAIVRLTAVPAAAVILINLVLLTSVVPMAGTARYVTYVVVSVLTGVILVYPVVALMTLMLSGTRELPAFSDPVVRRYLIVAAIHMAFLIPFKFLMNAGVWGVFQGMMMILPDDPRYSATEHMIAQFIGTMFLFWEYWLAFIVAFGVLVWPWLRLTFMGPLLVDHGRVSVAEAWRATRGLGLRLFGLGAVASLLVEVPRHIAMFNLDDVMFRLYPTVWGDVVNVTSDFVLLVFQTVYVAGLQAYAYKAAAAGDARTP